MQVKGPCAGQVRFLLLRTLMAGRRVAVCQQEDSVSLAVEGQGLSTPLTFIAGPLNHLHTEAEDAGGGPQTLE